MRFDGGGAPGVWPRLSLAKFTAKVGAGFRQYPRPGGVLVPRPLAPLLSPRPSLELTPLSQAARLRAGRDVILEVATVMRRLPLEVLVMPLPSPSVVVGTTPIEHRTRNVVERLVPFEGRHAWSVARYLEVARFGPRCLTDLLAAHEESVDEESVDEESLDEESLDEESLDEQSLRTPTGPAGDGEAAGAPPTPPIGVASAACAEATRQVAAWGLSEVDEVAARVRALSASPAGNTIVRRVLVAMPGLRWLDDRKRWFSFVGESSPLGNIIRKSFGATRMVELGALISTLATRSLAARRAPPPTLARYLSEIAGCEIVGGEVRHHRGDFWARSSLQCG
jgi:hypothetical protein